MLCVCRDDAAARCLGFRGRASVTVAAEAPSRRAMSSASSLQVDRGERLVADAAVGNVQAHARRMPFGGETAREARRRAAVERHDLVAGLERAAVSIPREAAAIELLDDALCRLRERRATPAGDQDRACRHRGPPSGGEAMPIARLRVVSNASSACSTRTIVTGRIWSTSTTRPGAIPYATNCSRWRSGTRSSVSIVAWEPGAAWASVVPGTAAAARRRPASAAVTRAASATTADRLGSGAL